MYVLIEIIGKTTIRKVWKLPIKNELDAGKYIIKNFYIFDFYKDGYYFYENAIFKLDPDKASQEYKALYEGIFEYFDINELFSEDMINSFIQKKDNNYCRYLIKKVINNKL